jgi:hypothetical protein
MRSVFGERRLANSEQHLAESKQFLANFDHILASTLSQQIFRQMPFTCNLSVGENSWMKSTLEAFNYMLDLFAQQKTIHLLQLLDFTDQMK